MITKTNKEIYLEAAEYFWLDEDVYAAHLCDSIRKVGGREAFYSVFDTNQTNKMVDDMAELFKPNGKGLHNSWWSGNELREERTMVLLLMAEMS